MQQGHCCVSSVPAGASQRFSLYSSTTRLRRGCHFFVKRIRALLLMPSRVSLTSAQPSIIGCGEIERTMASLEGRTALVTGASQGIGRACALALASAGARVALAARNEAKLAEVATEITASGGTAQVFAIDIASEDSIKAGAKAAISHFGSIEILVNNAGITKDGLMLRMKRADWDAVLSTNLTGTFLLTQNLDAAEVAD